MDHVELSRKLSIERHDLDAALFSNRYLNFSLDKFHDAFIYGRQMLIEEVNEDLDSMPANAKVLDVGCGTGHFSDFIYRKGFNVVGLEPAKNMINIAKELFPHINFIGGISAKIPFPDNHFDYIIAIEVFRYLDMQDNTDSYREFYRVLKPGGKILVTQVNRWSTDFYYPFYHLTNIYKRIFKKQLHYCLFTTAGKQLKVIRKIGYINSKAYGRMHGFVRIFYKFGNYLGKKLTGTLDKLTSKQKFSNAFPANLSGHLIVKAGKPF